MTTPPPIDVLTSTALVGTDRAGASRSPAAILDDAAAAFLTARAGVFPHQPAGRLPRAGPEELPTCTPRAAELLRQALAMDSGGETALEWATLATACQQRLLEPLLPLVLTLGVRNKTARAAFAPTLGARGHWLAALNPEWNVSSALPEDLDAAWQTLSSSQRRALFQSLRREHPTRALELLRSTWSTEASEDRADFTAALQTNLSMNDEPFLEDALKDKRKPVRAAAALLLARLPDSRYVARMAERADSMVTLAPGTRHSGNAALPTLTIEPPAEWDTAWERDALDEKPPSGRGKRAWWLMQILARVPPSRWSQRANCDAAALLTAAAATDHADELTAAWSEAAARFQDPAWCRALIDHRLNATKDPSDLVPLWTYLPPGDCESAAAIALRHPKVNAENRWHIAATVEHPWSLGFTATFLSLTDAQPIKPRNPYTIALALSHIARRIHPSAYPSIEAFVTRLEDRTYENAMHKALALLTLRAEIHKEFAP